MKVLIAEDEALARALLRTLLEETEGIEVVGEAEDAGQAVALADRLHPDAVFLDIDMPGGNGINAAHALQQRCSAEIVFVTAHEPHAVDAFELGAADYVLKPVRRPRLAKALDRLRARLHERQAAEAEPQGTAEDFAGPAFWVRTLRGRVRVDASDILRIEAARDHVYFHTAERSYLHRITMDELEEKLRGTDMVRVQRSAFVRLDKVRAIVRKGKSMRLELEGGTEVRVGPHYQARTLAALTASGVEERRPPLD